MAQRVTRANYIHLALEAHKQKDIEALKAAKFLEKNLLNQLEELSLEIFLNHPMCRAIRKLCPDAEVFISKQTHPDPSIVRLTWSDEHKDPKREHRRAQAKSSGEIRLTGNPRRRAIRLYKKLNKANRERRKAEENVREWNGRKKAFLKDRLNEHPGLVDRIRDICDIAFRSKSYKIRFDLEGDDAQEPGPLPVKGGIDSGKMWESQSIGSSADPQTAAKVMLECFNTAWIQEFRKELYQQVNKDG